MNKTTDKILTFKQWNKMLPTVKDISYELPDEFLLYGQIMRAKILWKNKKWYADAWCDKTVTLTISSN